MSDTEHDPLELESLDVDSLLTALAHVEKAIPALLLDVKPILAHLVSPTTAADEEKGLAAREAVEHYMNTLDKIQFVLRQTVFYLRGTRAAPSVLRAPPVDGVPRPLASTLRADPSPAASGEANLGLYGTRQEAAALREMLKATRALRMQMAKEEKEKKEAAEKENEKGDSIEVDAAV